MNVKDIFPDFKKKLLKHLVLLAILIIVIYEPFMFHPI